MPVDTQRKNKKRMRFTFLVTFWTLSAMSFLRPASAAQDESQILVPEGEPAPINQELVALRFGRIEHLVFSADGVTLALSTEEGTTCLWDLARGRPTRCSAKRVAKGVRTTALALSPQTKWVAAGHRDGSVELWRTDGNQAEPACRLGPLPEQLTLGRYITSVDFTADGSLLAVGGRNGTARVCPAAFETSHAPATATPKTPIKLPELAGIPSSLLELTAGEPNGKLLAVATSNAVGVWKLGSGEKLWLQPLPSNIMSLAMSADGRWIATGLLSGQLSLWDATNGAERRLPMKGPAAASALAFASDGSQLASGFDDGIIALWDTKSGKLLRQLPGKNRITAVAFRPDGGALASASTDGGMTLWETVTGNEVTSLRGNSDWIRSVAFNRAGARLATASDDQQVRIWKRRSDDHLGPEWTLGCSTGSLQAGIVRAVAFSVPDGKQLAIATDSATALLLDTETCATISTLERLESSGDKGRSVAISPNGRKLALGSDDTKVVLWDLEEGKRKPLMMIGHRDGVEALAFSPHDSDLLVTGSLDKTARLWDAVTGKLLHTFAAQPAGVHSLDISSDGKVLALASANEVTLWDLQSKLTLGKLSPPVAVTAVRFSPDGKLVATASVDGKVRLWDAVTQQLRFELTAAGEPAQVMALDFHPTGDVLAAATLGRVILWNLADQKEAAELWQGTAGWALLKPGERLYRSETGGLLWKREPDGSLAAIPPPAPQLAPSLDLQVRFRPAEEGGALLGTVIAVIKNVAGGPAYWLGVEASDLAGRHDLQEKLSTLSPAVHMRLAPGESVELPLRLLSRAPASPPPPTVRFCVTLRHNGQPGQESGQCQGGLARQMTLNLGVWWRRHVPELVLSATAGVLLLGAVLHLLRRRSALGDPVVRTALVEPGSLGKLRLRELRAADLALRRAEHFRSARGIRDSALATAGINDHCWQRAISALDSPTSCATQFTESLLAKLEMPPIYRDSELLAFKFLPPLLTISLPLEILLVICTSGTMSVQNAVAQCPPAALKWSRQVWVVDLTPIQAPPADSRQSLRDFHPGILFIILSEPVLRRILLARDVLQARDTLQKAIVDQCEPRQIARYQEGGNEIPADGESFFFGRQDELEQLLQRHQHNSLLVGPRSMGKSSLLNAFSRELARRFPGVKVLKHQLFSGNLRSIAAVDSRLSGETPELFYQSVMARCPEHQIFLLDEADKFVEQENKTQYPYCNVMRALSGQGRASFVLAGHQSLHEATLTPDHPLRNFGDLLRLDPLDRSSAERMISEPLTALGLRFADGAESVDWLRDQTGCRPHLLALFCWQLANLRTSPGSSLLDMEQIRRTVHEPRNLFAAFGAWEHRKVAPIDCALARAALLLGTPQPAELRDYLLQRGIRLPAGEFERSLNRLYAWHYVLIADAQGCLYCPVPLFHHFITDPRPEVAHSSQRWSSPQDRLTGELANDLAVLASHPAPFEALKPTTYL